MCEKEGDYVEKILESWDFFGMLYVSVIIWEELALFFSWPPLKKNLQKKFTSEQIDIKFINHKIKKQIIHFCYS